MITWHQFIIIVNAVFLRSTYVSVLTIIVGGRFLKNKPAVNSATAIIKWVIILGACLMPLTLIIEFLFSWFSGVEYEQYVIRSTGPYWWSYWLMFFLSVVLPLTLLYKPLGEKLWFVFAVSVLMNFGWLFERVLIYITSLWRNYIPSSWAMFYPDFLIWAMVEGVIIGIIALAIGHFIAKKKAKELSPLRP